MGHRSAHSPGLVCALTVHPARIPDRYTGLAAVFSDCLPADRRNKIYRHDSAGPIYALGRSLVDPPAGSGRKSLCTATWNTAGPWQAEQTARHPYVLYWLYRADTRGPTCYDPIYGSCRSALFPAYWFPP